MKKTINLFLYNIIKFIAPLLLLPLIVIITDPFDYLEYKQKINLDRIHTVRRINVADWALSEVSKINPEAKSRIKTVSIGDSRGRVLMSGGFEKGWEGRIYGPKNQCYDLSFGGAQLDESLSILNKELEYLDSLKTIIIVLPIDRIFTYKEHINRIENSQFNSKTPIVKYLFNYHQLTYFFYSNSGKGDLVKEKDEQDNIANSFIERYNTIDLETFNNNLTNIMTDIYILNKEYNIKIIIPPYRKDLFEKILKKYKEDYNYYLNALNTESIQVINLQSYENDFQFIDPVHGFVKNGNLNELIKERTSNILYEQ